MTTVFPGAIDSFTNPTPTDTLDSVTVPHADQHEDANDAIEALEAKVGKDSSAVTTSHDFKIRELETQDIFNETPSGTIDGVNATFTLVNTVAPANSLMLYKNGLLQAAGVSNDFTLSGSTITFNAGAIPKSGDTLIATYRK